MCVRISTMYQCMYWCKEYGGSVRLLASAQLNMQIYRYIYGEATQAVVGDGGGRGEDEEDFWAI